MNIEDYRKRIDEIDGEILSKLEERMRIVGEIAELKKREDLPVEDKSREEALLKKIEEMSGEDYSEYNQRVFERILEESKKFQATHLGE